jgi:hypothetical protein
MQRQEQTSTSVNITLNVQMIYIKPVTNEFVLHVYITPIIYIMW